MKDSDGKEIKLSNLWQRSISDKKNKCIKHSIHLLCALKFRKRKIGKTYVAYVVVVCVNMIFQN